MSTCGASSWDRWPHGSTASRGASPPRRSAILLTALGGTMWSWSPVATITGSPASTTDPSNWLRSNE